MPFTLSLFFAFLMASSRSSSPITSVLPPESTVMMSSSARSCSCPFRSITNTVLSATSFVALDEAIMPTMLITLITPTTRQKIMIPTTVAPTCLKNSFILFRFNVNTTYITLAVSRKLQHS